eukprot:jgi/Ulvmu1/9998/UM059_0047.1
MAGMQDEVDGLWESMGLLGSLPCLEGLLEDTEFTAQRPSIIPAADSSIVVTSTLGEGASAMVYAVERTDTQDQMALKKFHKVHRCDELLSEEIALMISLHNACDRIPPHIRLSTWQKQKANGTITALPLRCPFVKLLALSAHQFSQKHVYDENNHICATQLVKIEDGPAESTKQVAMGAAEEALPQAASSFWAVDGFYTDHYSASAQDVVDHLRRRDRPVADLVALRLMHGALLGLALMERGSYIHGDFKLENMLVQLDIANRLAYPAFTTEERPYTTPLPPVAISDFGHTVAPWMADRMYDPRHPLVTPGFRAPELCQATIDHDVAVRRGDDPPRCAVEVTSRIDVYAAGTSFSLLFVPQLQRWPYARTTEELAGRIARGTHHASGVRQHKAPETESPALLMARYMTAGDAQRRPSACAAYSLNRELLADLALHLALQRRDDALRGVVRKRKAWDRKCGLMAKAELATLGRAANTNTSIGDADDRAVAAAAWAPAGACLSHEACGLLFVGRAWPSHASKEDPSLRGRCAESADADAAASPVSPPASVAAQVACGGAGDGGTAELPHELGQLNFGGYIGRDEEDRAQAQGSERNSSSGNGNTDGGCHAPQRPSHSSHRSGSSGRLIGSNPGELSAAGTAATGSGSGNACASQLATTAEQAVATMAAMKASVACADPAWGCALAPSAHGTALLRMLPAACLGTPVTGHTKSCGNSGTTVASKHVHKGGARSQQKAQRVRTDAGRIGTSFVTRLMHKMIWCRCVNTRT